MVERLVGGRWSLVVDGTGECFPQQSTRISLSMPGALLAGCCSYRPLPSPHLASAGREDWPSEPTPHPLRRSHWSIREVRESLMGSSSPNRFKSADWKSAAAGQVQVQSWGLLVREVWREEGKREREGREDVWREQVDGPVVVSGHND